MPKNDPYLPNAIKNDIGKEVASDASEFKDMVGSRSNHDIQTFDKLVPLKDGDATDSFNQK